MATEAMPRAAGRREPGGLPTGWRMVRFDQMAASITERVDNPSEAGVEYYVGLEHLDPESLHIRRWGKPSDVEATKLRFGPGDIIFGRRRAYQRKLAVAEFEGICSAHALVLRAREDTVVKDFLPFFMQGDTFFERAISISVGSLSPTINWSVLAKQEFVLPPKHEQHRISEILWAADEAIAGWKEVLGKTESVRDAAVDMMMKSGGWPEKQLKQVCSRITDGTHQPPKFTSSGVPFLLISNLASGSVDWKVSKWISEETWAELTKRVRPEVGDVLYTAVGSFGVPVLVTWDRPFSFQRHIAILKPNREVLDGAYLNYFLSSASGKSQAELAAVGLAQRTVTLGALGNFSVPLPPLGPVTKVV